jgi:hypothetical protein
MSRLLLVVSVLLAACGGTSVSTSLPVLTPVPGQTAGPATPGSATGAPPAATAAPTSGAPGVAIPASCLTGFTDYLKKLEPAVAGFDPATTTFGDLQNVEEAARMVGIDLLTNGGGATYSCSEVGLEFAYFDSRSPWPAIFEVANAQAPGTVPYLQTVEELSANDNATIADYGSATCEDASTRIKAGVSGLSGAGADSVRDVRVADGLELLGLYKSYLHAVADGTCPDVLGNDEFDFFGAIG